MLGADTDNAAPRAPARGPKLLCALMRRRSLNFLTSTDHRPSDPLPLPACVHSHTLRGRPGVTNGSPRHPGASAEEEAERVPRRIKEHPYIVVRLKRCASRPCGDRIRPGLVKVIDSEIEMEHLLLLLGPFGPHGGLVPRLGLEREPGTAVRAAEQYPVRFAAFHLPAEQLPVEVRQRMSIRTVQDHRRKQNPRSPSRHRFHAPPTTSTPLAESTISAHGTGGTGEDRSRRCPG